MRSGLTFCGMIEVSRSSLLTTRQIKGTSLALPFKNHFSYKEDKLLRSWDWRWSEIGFISVDGFFLRMQNNFRGVLSEDMCWYPCDVGFFYLIARVYPITHEIPQVEQCHTTLHHCRSY